MVFPISTGGYPLGTFDEKVGASSAKRRIVMAKVRSTESVAATVTLELTEEEAGVLQCVLGCVAGARTGLRGVIDRIDAALEEVGVEPIGDPSGIINFPDEENSNEG
ncbi:hypothetical protein LCGC14_3015060 [marine sediment metagenome]|uniref:Uncharacterized protein n=1 Tax=marine sediment metagenome TaxID=412755 RepID=A0A0F8XJY5_9ZZZZ